jgi:hypothetical protein
VMCWQSRTSKRCAVSWCDGMTEPAFEFYSTTRGSMTPPIPIRNPDRFGFKPPRKLADFRAFVQRFADACENDDN